MSEPRSGAINDDQGEVSTTELLSACQAASVTRPRPTSGYEKPPLVHRVPRGRIRLDGESRPGSAVQQLDGKPLHFIMDSHVVETGEITVFTNFRDAQLYTGALMATDAGSASGTGEVLSTEAPEPEADDELGASTQALTRPVTFYGYVDLFEHINYSGRTWRFYTSWGRIPDFGHVYPTLWWTTNINDQVSSMDVNVNADPPGTVAWVVLFREINFGGDSLWTSNSAIGAGLRSDLSVVGWNDGASSLSYGYTVKAQ